MTKLNTLFNEGPDSDQVEAIKKAIGGGVRKVYDDHSKAQAAFNAATQAANGAIPAYQPTDDKGKPDSTPFTEEGVNTCVAVVGARVRNSKGKMEGGIKAIVMFPMPSAELFLDSQGDWVKKIIEKEAAHVAFRNLRNAETLEELEAAGRGMPLSPADFAEQHRRGDGVDTEAFDTLWSPLRKELKEAMPALVELLPQKGEVLKAIRSKPFAQQEYAPLEEKGVFEFLGKTLITAGQNWTDDEGAADPIDTSAIEDWLKGRDSFTIKPRTTEKDYSALEELDLGL